MSQMNYLYFFFPQLPKYMSILPVFLPAWNNLQDLKYWLSLKAKIFWHHLLVHPQAASAAALLSSALGCLSLQIFPKYRYLKVKKNSILPSTWWSQAEPFLSSLKLTVTIRNVFEKFLLQYRKKKYIYFQYFVCWETVEESYLLQRLTLSFTYFAEFSKKQWSICNNIHRIILDGK